MNAKQLYKFDNSEYVETGVWYCTNCRKVYLKVSGAEDCCMPKKCDKCHEVLEAQENWICKSCWDKINAEREKQKFDACKKVTFEKLRKTYEPDDYWFYDSVSDRYFSDDVVFSDHYLIEIDDFNDPELMEKLPKYLYLALKKPIQIPEFLLIETAEEKVNEDTEDGDFEFSADIKRRARELNEAMNLELRTSFEHRYEAVNIAIVLDEEFWKEAISDFLVSEAESEDKRYEY